MDASDVAQVAAVVTQKKFQADTTVCTIKRRRCSLDIHAPCGFRTRVTVTVEGRSQVDKIT